MATVSIKVAASTDDGYNYASTFVLDLSLLYVGHWDLGKGGSGTYHTTLRFPNVTIAKSATINSATLTLYVATAANEVPAKVIGEATDNPGALNNLPNGHFYPNSSGSWAGDTTASVTLTLSNLAHDEAQTATVTTIIQELVNRAGWASGNAMVLAVTGTGTTGTNYNTYSAWDLGESSHYATLDIDYTESSGTASIAANATVLAVSAVGGSLVPGAAAVAANATVLALGSPDAAVAPGAAQMSASVSAFAARAIAATATPGLLSQFAYPVSDNAAGTWTPSSGSDLYACVDEGTIDDTDYIRSGATPVNDTCQMALGPLSPPVAGTVTLHIRARSL